jgi:hypothetical protein
MTQRVVSRMYDNYEDARLVVEELETAGVPHSAISLVANSDAHGRTASSTGKGDAATGAGAGAVAGTVLGGAAGLLAGIGSLAIPGIGPVVAAGWLVATLTGAGVGAAAGGLVGSLTAAGVNRDEADVYAEGVRRGGSLVTVQTEEADAARVEAIMAQRGSGDWQQRRAGYGDQWTGFDEHSGSVMPDNRLAGTPAPTDEPAPTSVPNPNRSRFG